MLLDQVNAIEGGCVVLIMQIALPNSKKKLQALIASLRETLEARDQELQSQRQALEHREAQLKEQSALIEKLKFELARLKRWRFGKSTEGLSAEQLALWESELDGDIAALQSRLDALEAQKHRAGKADDEQKRQPKRRPLPESLPRVEVLHDLASKDCPTCGQGLERIGEEISEQLDIIPAKFFVRRHVRPKYCCRHCEQLHTAALPAQPIDKGIAAPGLIAQVAVGKYLEHQPLYRQEAGFERLGVAIPRSTMAGFREQGRIMIATEAGAEGINLQFCSLVVNYDLPWNPQRVEQRIGRCHRYGQQHDVVVVILERESEKWFRPAKGQFQIFYKSGPDHPEYQPDFVAETKDCIYMLESKARNEMGDADVLAKKEAAVKWCGLATSHATANGGKAWKYMLIPHDAITGNMTLEGLASRFQA